MFQTTLRNPLASPDIIGISLGASAAAVIALTFLDAQGLWLPAAALRRRGRPSSLLMYAVGRGTSLAGQRMVLVGIGVAALLSSVIQFVMTRTSIQDAQAALVWLTGQPRARHVARHHVLLVGSRCSCSRPCSPCASRRMRLAELGDDLSTTLGAPAAGPGSALVVGGRPRRRRDERDRARSPSSPSSPGPIARRLCGGRPSLWASALVGAVVVVLSDFAGDYLIPDVNLPVGVVTGALGAPLMLAVIVTAGRAGKA